MNPPCKCGCIYTSKGYCLACAEDATADELIAHAGKLLIISRTFKSHDLVQYRESLEAAIQSLRNEARNYRHVSTLIRRHKAARSTDPRD